MHINPCTIVKIEVVSMKNTAIVTGMLLALVVMSTIVAAAPFGGQPSAKQMKAVPGQNENSMDSRGVYPAPYGQNPDISQCIGAQPVQKQLFAGPGQLIGRMICWMIG